MSLSVDIRHRLGGFSLNASFETSGRLTALFGPSGSGKTTLVNLIGGLLRPEEGKIVADGRVLVDTTNGVLVPKHRRRIGYVFQDARLFPHMTVDQNLRYGRFFTPATERYSDMEGVIELLGISHLLDRRPNSLSGGEKQRVAIGRALLASPKLILMDEPLASLDDARKLEILPYIELLRDQAGVPIVYVSHSVAEVARLSTVVVVLDEGKVVAAGATSDILSRIDAPVIGGGPEAGSVLEAEVIGHDRAFGLTQARARAGLLQLPGLFATVGATLRVRILASDLLLSLGPLERISALNSFRGVVRALSPRLAAGAPSVDVQIDCGGELLIARVTAKSSELLALAPGREVYATVKSVSVDSLAGASYEQARWRAGGG